MSKKKWIKEKERLHKHKNIYIYNLSLYAVNNAEISSNEEEETTLINFILLNYLWKIIYFTIEQTSAR